ncbi:hypothetical protein BCR35DRAFT_299772 [Leucosporidium creatinivorum]|uniref:Uncharacterized protein n=1 Tax=Leucosporidium creatinivorum TaxID=106004 RepID=A0A1Y2G0V2_9BASI|nr:hypothetical protein BCR35DRAFT_299772 [Leucosporidium creatinivorum]
MKQRTPASASLQVPPNSSPVAGRHLSPSRSPGKRGRARKQPPPPPPTLKEQLQALRRDRRVWLGLFVFALFVFALVISALRIASHSSELSYRPPPSPPAPTTTLATHHRRRPRVGRAGADDAPAPAVGESKQEGQAINLDDVITEVLADTWDLPEQQPVQQAAAGEAPPSQARSYEELMKELEGTGLSVDDLSEALSEAYRD